MATWFLAMIVTAALATGSVQSAATVSAVFWPGTTSEQAFTAIIRAGGRPIGPTRLTFVWVADLDPDAARRLRETGGLATFRNVPFVMHLGGCIVALPHGPQVVFSAIEPLR